MSLSNFLKEQENISYQQYYYGCPLSKTLLSLRNHILWLRLRRGSDLIAYLNLSLFHAPSQMNIVFKHI